MKDIKIIMCDLDGTLLDENERLTTKTIQTMRRMKDKGYLFGLATGRPMCSVEKLMSQFKVNDVIDMVVALNGGYIKDYVLQKEEYHYLIDGQLIKKVVQHFDGFPVNFGVYLDNYLAVMYDDALAKRLALSDQIPYQVVDFDKIYKSQQSKLIVITDPMNMERVASHGRLFYDPQLKSLQAGKIEYEYMHPQLSKSFGLNQICEWHHLTLENMLAFGDADNDADMIKNAGIGVAMANGSELTRSYADAVTLSHQDDGVAEYLQKYMLGDNHDE